MATVRRSPCSCRRAPCTLHRTVSIMIAGVKSLLHQTTTLAILAEMLTCNVYCQAHAYERHLSTKVCLHAAACNILELECMIALYQYGCRLRTPADYRCPSVATQQIKSMDSQCSPTGLRGMAQDGPHSSACSRSTSCKTFCRCSPAPSNASNKLVTMHFCVANIRQQLQIFSTRLLRRTIICKFCHRTS